MTDNDKPRKGRLSGWWYLAAIPGGVAVNAVLYGLRAVVSTDKTCTEGLLWFLEDTGIALSASLWFPVGMFLPFITERTIHDHCGTMMVVGWAVYVTIIVMGMTRRSTMWFLALCMLVTTNIVGCQLSQADAFVGGVMQFIP